MPVEIGSEAPAFELRNQGREKINLAGLRGKNTLVVFIPFPFTGTCSAELCAIRDNIGALAALDANVVAITCDTVASNAHWAEENAFGFDVLSDFWPHGATAQAYGAFDDRFGYAKRYTYVLDADGIVRDVIRSEELGVAREFDAYTDALANI